MAFNLLCAFRATVDRFLDPALAHRTMKRLVASRQNQLERTTAPRQTSLLEGLESRVMLSSADPVNVFTDPSASLTLTPGFIVVTPDGGISPLATLPSGVTPTQMRHAYGIDQIMLGSVTGDGTGQTIAIVDAYDQPNALSDLNYFSQYFGLPSMNLAGGPTFTKINQTGGSTPPTASAIGGWSVEISLDIEWAHVIAPQANLVLIEANTNSYSDLMTAVDTARHYANVSAVSLSWGSNEFSSESVYDSYFTTPAGHNGVTFVASTGDTGQPGGYPAYSPNVLAVGGTTLSTDAAGNYVSETGWSGSGGGISLYQSQPGYQVGKVTQSSTKRTIPDVSMDADPASGVPVYDTYDYGVGSPWAKVGGTSLSAPMYAGIIAIANQGRAINGQTSFDGVSQTLPLIYNLPAADFHDVTSGSNGFSAGAGYDLVTGRGSPIANLLVPGLAPVSGPPIVQSIIRNNSTTTNATSVSYTVTFSKAVTGVDPTDFTLIKTGTVTTGLPVVSGSGSSYVVIISSITGDGTLGLNLVDDDTIVDASSVALGGSGVGNGNFTGQVYTIDHTPPTVTSIVRTSPVTSPSNANSASYTVTFSESVTGVDTADFAVNWSGTVSWGTAAITGSGTTYTVTISGITGDGSMALYLIDNDTIVDAATNPLGGVGTGNGNANSSTLTWDHTAPTVSSIVRTSPASSPSNATSATYIVTFSENVTGVDATDFALAKTGTIAGGTPVVTGGGSTYTVTIPSITGDGTLGLNLVDNDTIVDAATNPLGGVGTGNGNANSATYVVDQIPVVSSIVRASPTVSSTNAAHVIYTVTFSKNVTGVDVTDFALVTSGTVSSGTPVVAGAGAAYTVTIPNITGDGTLGLNLIDNDTIVDAAGNVLGGSGVGNGNFIGQIYALDHIAPSVVSIVRTSPATSPSNSTTVVYTITFSESVTGVDYYDFTQVITGTIQTGTTTLSGSGTTYTVTLSYLSGFTGMLGLNVVDDDTIIDAAGNSLGGSGVGNGSATGPTVTLDFVPPSVTSIVRTNPTNALANATSVAYTINFSKNVTGVDSADLQVVTTGLVTNGAISVSGGGATYTVTIPGITGSGTLGLNVINNGTIIDLVGNVLGGGATTNPYTYSYSVPISYGVNTSPGGLATADLNGDGKLDLIMTNSGSGATPGTTLSVLLGNGDGTFQAQTDYATGGLSPLAVVTGDVNGDGKLDLIVANRFSASIGILLGNGDGTFASVSVMNGPTAASLAVADLDKDGKLDIVYGGYSAVYVLRGNGDGAFQPYISFPVSEINALTIAVSDLNGDGWPDVVATLKNSNSVAVLMGTGTTSIFGSATTFPAGATPGSLAIADINGDGKPDVVVGGTFSATISVLLGNGTGGFSTQTQSSFYPLSVLNIADINNDGKPDIVTAYPYLMTYTGNGDGTFNLGYTSWNMLVVASALVTGDFTGNGRPDLAILSPYRNALLISANISSGNTIGPIYTIDQTPPAPPTNLTLLPADDTGLSSTDGITSKNTALHITGTAEANSSITLTGVGPTPFTITGGADAAGAWAVTIDAILADGNYTLTATAADALGNTSSVSNSLTLNIAAVPASLAVVPGSISAVAGVAIPTFTVSVLNAFGFVVDNATPTVSLSMTSNPAGSLLTGAFTAVAAGGVAAFGGLTLSKPGSHTFNFTSPGLITGSATFTVAPSQAPVINLNSATLFYPTGAVNTLIDPSSVVTDSDTANFNTGSLRVAITTLNTSTDILAITNQGSAAGQIGVSGANVFFGGTLIGNVTGGAGLTPLVVNFNANATPAATEALLRAICYRNTLASVASGNRVVTFTLNDGAGGIGTASRTINVEPNQAPILAGANALTPIPENAFASAGNTVASLIAGQFSDPNVGSFLSGVALTSIDNSKGIWQYSLNNGATWNYIFVASPTSALLLRDTDLLRFVPKANFYGTSSVAFCAWDQTSGVAGGRANASISGGATALSTAQATSTIAVTFVNQPPVVTLLGTLLNYSAGGAPIYFAPTALVTDVDSLNFNGGTLTIGPTADVNDRIAIFNKGTWSGMIGVSGANVTYGGVAFGTFIGGNDGLTPLVVTLNSNATPAAILTLLRDLTYSNVSATPLSGVGDHVIPITLTDGAGGTANATRTVTILTNQAPVLAGANAFTAIQENALVSVGDTVASLLAGQVTDADAGALSGIALTGINNTNGAWQYSTTNGSTWLAVTSASPTSALLLRDTDLLRFVPKVNFYGTSSVTFLAWDQTSGITGSRVNTSIHGGATPFSQNAAIAPIAVLYQDQPPVVIVPSGILTYIAATAPIYFAPSATVTDVDSVNFNGGTLTVGPTIDVNDRIAIVNRGTAAGLIGVSGANVTYGGVVFGTFTGGNDGISPLVVTLNSSATPAVVQALLRDLTYSNVSASPLPGGHAIPVALNDGAGATGSATRTVTMFVNQAPVLAGANALTTLAENPLANPGDSVASLIAGQITDADAGALSGIAVTGIDNVNGTWQYSITNGSTWIAVVSASLTSALLLRNADLLRFVPKANFYGTSSVTFLAWDQTSGVASGRANASIHGGATALSDASATSTIAVTFVNQPPVVTLPGTLLNYSAGGAPIYFAPTALVTDVDSLNFNGGTLTIGPTADINDRIAIFNKGTTAGLIGVSGANVTYGGVVFGTFTGGNDGISPLVVTLNNNATPAAVLTLLRDLTYSNVSATPLSGGGGGDHAIAITLTDGAGGTANATRTVTILANQAPVLTGANAFTPIPQNTFTSAGNTVASLIAGQVTDPDAGALTGIALTGIDNSKGFWQYSLNNGIAWNYLFTASPTSALLLRGTDLLRFVPKTNFIGTASVTFLAWDQTNGSAGSRANTSIHGGATPWSDAQAIASISVTV